MDKPKNCKIAIILLLLLEMAGVVEAQTHEFAPVGAEWYYGINNFSTEGYVRIKSVSDTIIDGATCKKIEKRYFLFDHQNPIEQEYVKGHEYISQIGDSIMIYRYGRFYKLYDFTAELGDTLSFPGSYSYQADEFVFYGDSIGKAVVVGKGVCEIEGLELKYYDLKKTENSAWAFVQDFHLGCARICEKIGNMSGYLFPEQQLIADYYEGGTLRCYTDDEIGTASFSTPYIECDYFHAIEEDALQSPTVYPNPSSGKIHIESKEVAKIQVYNSLGQLVKTIPNTNEVSLEGLPEGVYLLRVTLESGKVFSDKVVKE